MAHNHLGPCDSMSCPSYEPTEEDLFGVYDSDYDSLDDSDDSVTGAGLSYSDLRNTRTFLSYNKCPYGGDPPFFRGSDSGSDTNDGGGEPRQEGPDRHWCFLGEIVENLTLGRVVLDVKDLDGETIRVAFYYGNGVNIDQRSIRVGYVIAVLYPQKHHFLDGSEGLRLENPGHVKIFPCDLATLLNINVAIENETPVDRSRFCQNCGTEDHPDKSILQRCSRCLAISYCGKQCQTDSWKDGHKQQCKLFKELNSLKTGRTWDPYIFKRPLDFDEQESSGDNKPEPYLFDPKWTEALPARVTELKGAFHITSGELIWGQADCLSLGLRAAIHDQPSSQDKLSDSGIIRTQAKHFRTPARSGSWKLARVNGYGNPSAPKDSWIAYHSDCDPVSLLLMARSVKSRGRDETGRVACVDRYDWGTHFSAHDEDLTPRTFADIDPGSGWKAAVERRKRLRKLGKECEEGHPDFDRWEKLIDYSDYGTFLVDAIHGPEAVKLLARSSELDSRRDDCESSSLHPANGGTEAFGCYLKFLGEEWEVAKLIFSEEDSINFPGEKELIAFWYDQTNDYDGSEGDPIVADV